jgi:hypothetical protein
MKRRASSLGPRASSPLLKRRVSSLGPRAASPLGGVGGSIASELRRWHALAPWRMPTPAVVGVLVLKELMAPLPLAATAQRRREV